MFGPHNGRSFSRSSDVRMYALTPNCQSKHYCLISRCELEIFSCFEYMMCMKIIIFILFVLGLFSFIYLYRRPTQPAVIEQTHTEKKVTTSPPVTQLPVTPQTTAKQTQNIPAVKATEPTSDVENSEKDADPEAVKKRDAEENSLHQLQHGTN